MRKRAVFLILILLLDVFLAGICLSAALMYGRSGGGAAPGGSVSPVSADERAGRRPGEMFLALTFDDGPHRVYTRRLLEGLRERGIRASFFLVGENIPGNEELIRQMAEDGHLIGTHCYSHEDLTKKTTAEACRDILKTNEMVRAITGRTPEHIRPPYGIWSEELEECLGMTPVFWDIDTLDWQTQSVSRICAHICKNAGRHEIILLHDVFDTSVEAALQAVDTLTAQGYTFVTIDELLID